MTQYYLLLVAIMFVIARIGVSLSSKAEPAGQNNDAVVYYTLCILCNAAALTVFAKFVLRTCEAVPASPLLCNGPGNLRALPQIAAGTVCWYVSWYLGKRARKPPGNITLRREGERQEA